MPIYEYECTACGSAFEQLIRSQRDERAAACPACGSPEITRQPSVFAAHGCPTRVPAPPAGCDRCGDLGGRCPFG